MDLVVEVDRQFGAAAAKSGHRLSHLAQSKSKQRQGDRRDPSERLMSRIIKASRPNAFQKPVTKPAPKAKQPKDEPQILPVPKDSAHG